MTTEQKVIKNKLGLLKLAETLGSVSQACKVMGYSRDSFYRFRDLYDTGGALALQDLSRRKPVPKNRVDTAIESEILALAIDKPAYGQVRVSNELKKRGMFVSPGGVRGVWQRNELETFRKRLKALEAKVAQEGLILSEDQIRAMEKAREEKEAHGEIETAHPGYLGAQDTYYVGTIKGVGAFISKPSSTRIRRSLTPSSMTGGTPWWRQICSTTAYCPSSRNTACHCCES